MRGILVLVLSACLHFGCAITGPTAGVEALLKRRLPQHCDDFIFTLSQQSQVETGSAYEGRNDEFMVSNGPNGTIHITGNSPIALTSGLRWYLSNIVHVDIYWFIGSRLSLAPLELPALNASYHGSSVVPWRYHFNTVTFSYTMAFWTWEDWELQLDWMALRGVNLALAWVGYEKILGDVLQEAGFSQTEISNFFSGPAFQAWNRFGNIQGSWNGKLTTSWIEKQFALNKQIVARMVELGITPILPCFTGFVPPQIERVFPNASFVNGSRWSSFPAQYTNVTFLEPFDPHFERLQKSFISKQRAAYGNVTKFYTLDQYNENNPYSGSTQYLHDVANNTIQSLKAADPNAIWFLQGWLFFAAESFWTSERAAAYLGGVKDSDMLILDLFSESQPQWQRTQNYFGKPWIWCELHGYGGNMGLYGQVENVTINSVEALGSPNSNMVGMGLTMEGEEGNEIMYDLLLDQAWSRIRINTQLYFHNWVTSRYHGASTLPPQLYTAWDRLRQTVYNNTNLALAEAVSKSILELSPNTTGLANITGHHPTAITYTPSTLVSAWKVFLEASSAEPSLWSNEPYLFDLTDLTRQVLANAFTTQYQAFVAAANHSNPHTHSPAHAKQAGQRMLALLQALDAVLLANGNAHFSLPAWLAAAEAWAEEGSAADAAFLEYNAKNQVTLWGPTGEISDYASKQWGGLVRGYYLPRWERFVAFTLNGTTGPQGQNAALRRSLMEFELAWQTEKGWLGASRAMGLGNQTLRETIERVRVDWADVF